MKTPIPKTFTPAQDMILAAEAVFLAMAFTQTVKPIVQEYQKAILEKYQFRTASQWTSKGMKDEVILDPKSTYLMNDDDFAKYIDEVHKARDESGLKVDGPDKCPLLVAEHLQTKAERVLIEAMEPITHLSAEKVCSSIEIYQKMVDLSLKLLAPFVKNAKDILSGIKTDTTKGESHAIV